ncbi:hypothetical protein [Spirillospora sp. CA-128828]|uniref:hypothetical protein n=1 Tax=Spirillospora sp. CA-128828 TaxID=3240033 RepID=UPI003D8FA714
MSQGKTARGLRLVGGGLIVLELLIQQSGFALSSRVDSLAAALWMSVFGSFLLLGYARMYGSFGVRDFGSLMWESVIRVGVSNSVIGVTYVIAVAKLGLGVTAAITALGPLFVGFWGKPDNPGILRSLGESRPVKMWAWEQIALRAAAFGGVVLVNQPWKWLDDFDADTAIGLVAAVAAAVCFWNYIVCVFGKMDPEKTKGGLAVANLVSVPLTVFTVWVAGRYMGGGMEVALSLKVIGISVVAGVLALTLPAVIQDLATGKVSDRITGVLYLLDSPLAALIGVLGVTLGVLSDNQFPDTWVWVGIAVVVSAALRVTLKGDKPDNAPLSA